MNDRPDRDRRTPAPRGRFDVWAPLPDRVRLSVGAAVVPMVRDADGWWTPTEPVPDGEVDYGYLVDDEERPLPDPRSRRQPAGVHERSRTFDPTAHRWTDDSWTGRQLAGGVIYELHVGTFTPEGTLDAAADGRVVDAGLEPRHGRAVADEDDALDPFGAQDHPHDGLR